LHLLLLLSVSFSDRLSCFCLGGPQTKILLSLLPKYLGLQVCATTPALELCCFTEGLLVTLSDISMSLRFRLNPFPPMMSSCCHCHCATCDCLWHPWSVTAIMQTSISPTASFTTPEREMLLLWDCRPPRAHIPCVKPPCPQTVTHTFLLLSAPWFLSSSVTNTHSRACRNLSPMLWSPFCSFHLLPHPCALCVLPS
jgi:hypothetical protein